MNASSQQLWRARWFVLVGDGPRVEEKRGGPFPGGWRPEGEVLALVLMPEPGTGSLTRRVRPRYYVRNDLKGGRLNRCGPVTFARAVAKHVIEERGNA